MTATPNANIVRNETHNPPTNVNPIVSSFMPVRSNPPRGGGASPSVAVGDEDGLLLFIVEFSLRNRRSV